MHVYLNFRLNSHVRLIELPHFVEAKHNDPCRYLRVITNSVLFQLYKHDGLLHMHVHLQNSQSS